MLIDIAETKTHYVVWTLGGRYLVVRRAGGVIVCMTWHEEDAIRTMLLAS
jgi:hypothetical protein